MGILRRAIVGILSAGLFGGIASGTGLTDLVSRMVGSVVEPVNAVWVTVAMSCALGIIVTLAWPLYAKPVEALIGKSVRFISGKKPMSAPDATPILTRETALGKALGFLVFGDWSSGDFFTAINKGAGGKDGAIKAFEGLHQAARDGDIIVWGRKSANHAWEAINANHWAIYTFNWYSTWHDGTYQGAKDELIRRDNARENSDYQDLMVSRAQIEKLWPNGLFVQVVDVPR